MANQDTPGVIPGGSFTGVGSASAQAARAARGEEEIPTGDARGSQVEDLTRDEIEPDGTQPGQAPVGLQAEEAQFTSNGSVLGNMVASPSGPVPVSLVAGDVHEAQEILEERAARIEKETEGRNPDRKFTEDEINQLDGGELRALAQRRGYQNFPGAGTRAARQAFLRNQAADPVFKATARKAATPGTSTDA